MRKAIFWDFDGTLVRSNHLWSNSFLKAAGELGSKYRLTYETVHPLLCKGFPWDKDGTPNLKGEAWWSNVQEKLSRDYRSLGLTAEEAACCSARIRGIVLSPENYKVYPDAAPTLAVCIYKGYKNYLLSNNFPELEELLPKLWLDRFFSGCIVSGMVGADKPDEKIFRLAQLKASFPSLCYMVGDSPEADAEGGKNAGMKTVLVHSAPSARADVVCDTLSDILMYL